MDAVVCSKLEACFATLSAHSLLSSSSSSFIWEHRQYTDQESTGSFKCYHVTYHYFLKGELNPNIKLDLRDSFCTLINKYNLHIF